MKLEISISASFLSCCMQWYLQSSVSGHAQLGSIMKCILVRNYEFKSFCKPFIYGIPSTWDFCFRLSFHYKTMTITGITPDKVKKKSIYKAVRIPLHFTLMTLRVMFKVLLLLVMMQRHLLLVRLQYLSPRIFSEFHQGHQMPLGRERRV